MSGHGEAAGAVDQFGVVPQRLRPYRPRSGQIERSELLGRIRSEAPLVLVLQAGAGFGKSTLLSQLSATDDRPTAWVSVDPSDADPMVLIRHVVRSLDMAGLDVSAAETALSTMDPNLAGVVLPALAEALDSTTERVLVVLDDVHLLGEAKPADGQGSPVVVEQLLGMIPDGSTIALAGRATPGVRLARRELDGEVLTLRQDDLAFDDDESLQILDRMLPGVVAAVADDVIGLTERWPAGVYLGALAVREHPNPGVLIREVLGSDRRTIEYLQEEVLDRLDSDTRRWLREVAVLEQLSAPACDATTGGDDGAERLGAMVASGNLLLSAVADTADSFRLHQLLADQLLAELRAVDPDRERELRRNASGWLDEVGRSDAAVRQALLADDLGLAARIVHRHHAPALLRGEVATLERWIESFPGDVVATDGMLSLAAGWSALVRGDRRVLGHHLTAARKLRVDGALPDGTADYEIGVAALSMMAEFDGVVACARDAAVVVDAGPGGSPWWHLARLTQAVSLTLAGLADPLDTLSGAELDTRGHTSVHVVATAQLAIAQLRAGDLAAAEALSDRAIEETEAAGLSGYAMLGMVHCAASLVAAFLGEAERSAQHADDAATLIQLSESVVPRAAVQSRQLLAEAALEVGDPATAAQMLRAARERLNSERDALVLAELQEQLERRLSTASRRPTDSPLTSAELRVLEQLPTHRSLKEIAELLFVSHNTVKTHTVAIYRKLGVSGRGEAVRVATGMGLLDRRAPDLTSSGSSSSGRANREGIPRSAEH